MHRYAKYKELQTLLQSDNLQPAITIFGIPGSNSYSNNHPRQKAITASIIADLIIDCNLPLSLVEHPSFRNFMSVVDPKYVNISRTTVTSMLAEMTTAMEAKIKEDMSKIDGVSVTVDVWSDRKMRGFLGVTGHVMEVTDKSLNLKSYLLGCSRFKGSHTGEKISTAFESICDKYSIRKKLDYILTDNASNMKKAFTVCLATIDETEERTSVSMAQSSSDDTDDIQSQDGIDLDDDSIWELLDPADQETVDQTLAVHCKQQRLSCYAHTLQLTVGDGLKDARSARPALAKANRLSTLMHTSSSFRDSFEKKFGTAIGIPAAVCTRWNSTLRQVQSIIRLDYQALSEVCIDHKEALPTEREWSVLKELVEILSPFLQATDLLQGDKVVTISAVVPSVLSLNHHLQRLQGSRDRYLMPMIKALQKSLKHRFTGVFINARLMPKPKPSCQTQTQQSAKPDAEEPFSDKVYLLSALLDPTFAMMWIDTDVLVEEKEKASLKVSLKGILITVLGNHDLKSIQ